MNETYYSEFYKFLELSEAKLDKQSRNQLREERERFLSWLKRERKRISPDLLNGLLFSWLEAKRLRSDLAEYAQKTDAGVKSAIVLAETLEAFAKESEEEKIRGDFSEAVKAYANDLREKAQRAADKVALLSGTACSAEVQEVVISAETIQNIYGIADDAREIGEISKELNGAELRIRAVYTNILRPLRKALRAVYSLLAFRNENGDLLVFVDKKKDTDGRKNKAKEFYDACGECIRSLKIPYSEKWQSKLSARIAGLIAAIEVERKNEETLVNGKIAEFGKRIRTRMPSMAIRSEDHPDKEYFVDCRGKKVNVGDGAAVAAVTVRALDAALNSSDGLPIMLTTDILKQSGLIAENVGFVIVLDSGYMPETGPLNARIPKFKCDDSESFAFDPRALRNLFGAARSDKKKTEAEE